MHETTVVSRAPAYQDSIAYKDLLDLAHGNPRDTFDTCPVTEVRLECIRALRGQWLRSEELAQWFEDRVRSGWENGDDLWSKLLDCYMDATGQAGASPRIRALNFAIDLALDDDNFGQDFSRIAKIIVEVIKDHPDLYWATKKMDRLLERGLSHLQTVASSKPRDTFTVYPPHLWDGARRCIELARMVRDVTFLPSLLELRAYYKAFPLCGPRDDKDGVKRSEHQACMARSIEVLKAAYAEQGVGKVEEALHPLAQLLKEKGGFDNTPRFNFAYVEYYGLSDAQQLMKDGAPDDQKEVKATLHCDFAADDAGEQERVRLAELICKLGIRVDAEGCTLVRTDFQKNGLDVVFVFHPTWGQNRFNIRINSPGPETQQIASATCYFYLAYA